MGGAVAVHCIHRTAFMPRPESKHPQISPSCEGFFCKFTLEAGCWLVDCDRPCPRHCCLEQGPRSCRDKTVHRFRVKKCVFLPKGIQRDSAALHVLAAGKDRWAVARRIYDGIGEKDSWQCINCAFGRHQLRNNDSAWQVKQKLFICPKATKQSFSCSILLVGASRLPASPHNITQSSAWRGFESCRICWSVVDSDWEQLLGS